jgi:hypothetical protein
VSEADLTSRFSPRDVLLQYSKVYRVVYDAGEIITEVPKKVRELEKKPGLDLFPKT